MKEPLVTVQDDFLPKDLFSRIEEVMFGIDIKWDYQPNATYPPHKKGAMVKLLHRGPPDSFGGEDTEYQFCFNHLFWGYNGSECHWSEYYEELCVPFLKRLEIPFVTRIKANLLVKQSRPSIGAWHLDLTSNTPSEIKLMKHYCSAIYYCNTNNGYTELQISKNKTRKIESVANRLVIFPTNVTHRAVGQTDENARIVINFLFIF